MKRRSMLSNKACRWKSLMIWESPSMLTQKSRSQRSIWTWPLIVWRSLKILLRSSMMIQLKKENFSSINSNWEKKRRTETGSLILLNRLCIPLMLSESLLSVMIMSWGLSFRALLLSKMWSTLNNKWLNSKQSNL